MGDILHELLRRDEQEEHGRSSRFHKVMSLGIFGALGHCLCTWKMLKISIRPSECGPRISSLQKEDSIHSILDLFSHLLVTCLAWQKGTKKPPMSTAAHMSVLSHLGPAP